MNKFIGALSLLAVCALAAGYTDMDDSLNVEALSKDTVRLKQYMDCFLDRTPCIPQMMPYKNHLLEAITDGCAECNDVERHMLKVFIQTVKGFKNGDYELLKAKFDPNKHMETTFADVAQF